MDTADQKNPDKPSASPWQRVIKGFAVGTFFGAITVAGITAATLGLSGFVDTSPSIIGGTRRTGSLLITFFWGIIGAAGGAVLGAIINLPRAWQGKLMLAGVIAALLAALFLIVNTTSFL